MKILNFCQGTHLLCCAVGLENVRKICMDDFQHEYSIIVLYVFSTHTAGLTNSDSIWCRLVRCCSCSQALGSCVFTSWLLLYLEIWVRISLVYHSFSICRRVLHFFLLLFSKSLEEDRQIHVIGLATRLENSVSYFHNVTATIKQTKLGN